MGRVKLTSRIMRWTDKTENKIDRAVLEMATDTHRVATVLSPKETYALANSGRIVRRGIGHYAVIFGGGAVPYARRRHFENEKTPGSLRYLERAGDATSRNFRRYIKDI